jgi:hypothetical protein
MGGLPGRQSSLTSENRLSHLAKHEISIEVERMALRLFQVLSLGTRAIRNGQLRAVADSAVSFSMAASLRHCSRRKTPRYASSLRKLHFGAGARSGPL